MTCKQLLAKWRTVIIALEGRKEVRQERREARCQGESPAKKPAAKKSAAPAKKPAAKKRAAQKSPAQKASAIQLGAHQCSG
jgi:predicted kinase